MNIQYRVLSLLRDNGPLSRAQLADRLEVPRPRLLGELDRMVAAGRVSEAGPAASRGGRRSTLVQLGLGGDVSIPQNMVVAKEIEMKGTFRFHEEFALAIDLINKGRVDLKPLLTETYPLDDAIRAFEVAGDRNRSMKVQIAF